MTIYTFRPKFVRMNWKNVKITAANEAIKIAGGQVALTAKLNARYGALGLPLPGKSGFTQYQIGKWSSVGIQSSYVLHVEALTGVSRHRLSPETFGTEAGIQVA